MMQLLKKQTLLRFALAVAMLFSVFVTGGLRAQSSEDVETKEARLKSAFLLNFARYVEWPPKAFASSNSPVVIGVLGQDCLGQNLDATIEGRTVERRRVQMKRSRNIADLTGCHVIFICNSERDRLAEVLAQLADKPVLTVSDIDGFTAANGMIQLKKKQNMMRFDINRGAAEKAGLKMSSKLLKLADNPQ